MTWGRWQHPAAREPLQASSLQKLLRLPALGNCPPGGVLQVQSLFHRFCPATSKTQDVKGQNDRNRGVAGVGALPRVLLRRCAARPSPDTRGRHFRGPGPGPDPRAYDQVCGTGSARAKGARFAARPRPAAPPGRGGRAPAGPRSKAAGVTASGPRARDRAARDRASESTGPRRGPTADLGCRTCSDLVRDGGLKPGGRGDGPAKAPNTARAVVGTRRPVLPSTRARRARSDGLRRREEGSRDAGRGGSSWFRGAWASRAGLGQSSPSVRRSLPPSTAVSHAPQTGEKAGVRANGVRPRSGAEEHPAPQSPECWCEA